jgi:tRNA threonylcarbamoyladenosine biosynthesis protein TsaE
VTQKTISVVAADEVAMESLGASLAAACEPGLVMFLRGGLGMGKTTLCRGFIQSLGHEGAVKSPTYTLVEPYELGSLQVYHFDLYRLGDPEELEFMGIRDYFGDLSVCLVEWPERGQGALPEADLVINIQREGQGRVLAISAQTARGIAVLVRLRTGLPGEEREAGQE